MLTHGGSTGSGMRHLLSGANTLCSSILSTKLGVDVAEALQLIKFGAVYLQRHVDTKPRRILVDVDVLEGEYIRAHPFPKRFVRRRSMIFI